MDSLYKCRDASSTRCNWLNFRVDSVLLNSSETFLGALYISQYFTKEDKDNAEKLVEFILNEYRETIKSSTWMDDATKEIALKKASLMVRYIGYHENLRTPEAETFYADLPPLNEDNFLEMGMAFSVFSADREYKLLYDKVASKMKDWTK